MFEYLYDDVSGKYGQVVRVDTETRRVSYLLTDNLIRGYTTFMWSSPIKIHPYSLDNFVRKYKDVSEDFVNEHILKLTTLSELIS